MALIWKNEYSVGVPEMDKQHRALVDILSQLESAMGKGKGKEVIGKILVELFRYTQSHFRDEENLMTTRKYADLTSHRAEHAKLTQQVLAFKKDFDAGKATLTIPVLNFLENWLITHIQGLDKKYGLAFSNS